MPLNPSQPGPRTEIQGQPDKGDRLFQLANDLHFTGGSGGPTDLVLCRDDEDPDTLWAFEFHKDGASFERHFANPVIDANHDEVIDLLAEQPMRVTVRPVFSDFSS